MEGQRERKTPADSTLSIGPDTGLKLTTPRSPPETKSELDAHPTAPPRCPETVVLLCHPVEATLLFGTLRIPHPLSSPSSQHQYQD